MPTRAQPVVRLLLLFGLGAATAVGGPARAQEPVADPALELTEELAEELAAAQRAPLLAPLDASRPITYFIADGAPGSRFENGDAELAEWALAEWARHGRGALRFEPAAERAALLRVYFVAASFGQYGEMRPLMIGGRRGAAVYVRPDTDALGPEIALAAQADPLLRDTIVYLTCLHELGHALGLVHTDDFRDIMYFFGFGGDISRFFGRYREQLGSRDDIRIVSGASAGDLGQLRELYGGESND